MRTQVAIIGGGPSGLTLSQLLNKAGIATVVLERKSRDYVLSRIRAGILEWGAVELFRTAGAGARMDREGIVHDGTCLASDGRLFRVDFHAACGKQVMVYGQTEITRDLYDAQDAIGASVITEADNVELHDVTGDKPFVTYSKDGVTHRIDCDYIAGCDGFHGVSRPTIPASVRREFEKVYPFGWLGLLSRTPPVHEELIYARTERGFALASMRNPLLSRYYVQVPLTDTVEAWSDEAFWDEFRRRMPEAIADSLVTGPSIEKSIAPLRSFVSEPLRWGRLFLCGDAGHIVPPTGAKGLNLAASDVHYLFEALKAHYERKDDEGLDRYSEKALARIWQAMRFSWSVTMMMHRFPGQSDYETRMQVTDLAQLEQSETARKLFAENYTGLPY
ncbi:4-hydroxybenzoate 3-monooxygenase [Oryzibacter oryziterrae]|uniref:4-hydroxybenzoate 3-monooxygenase n=1 Tax=Oryzibacter oryziterrae TaxID=2766474 RepID=UPI001F007F33|nr:4-hydroxybenzoate 3-monooxygenase [Oryzibacter oryziterrae]